MKAVLITGSRGFIGKNLRATLSRNPEIILRTFDRDDEPGLLDSLLAEVDFIYHFAGVNRPQNPQEFESGNTQLTVRIVESLQRLGRTVPILLTSSSQAEQDNPYGRSKKAAEDALIEYHKKTGAPVFIYRLPGVFGKWSRPDYNTVVATYCHNIARNLEITITNPDHLLELVYIDDVVRHFTAHLQQSSLLSGTGRYFQINTTFRVTLGDLAAKIYSLRDMRTTLRVPDLSDYFMRCLNATYLSFLDSRDFSYPLDLKTDQRGSLFELIKSEHFGQIFVSKTFAGITRGNHYHDSKIEKFCVIQGSAVIRFRHIFSDEVVEYCVSGEKIEVVDIPPGYTHHIENVGEDEMICLFWANQIFDPEKPDTYMSLVRQ
jgi:UDP-2-acetamido-2,6-beta-L-arabino-hexul-4-ose reductase